MKCLDDYTDTSDDLRFTHGKAAVREFESLIRIILINNSNCSLKKLFLFYLSSLCLLPKIDIQFLGLSEFGTKNNTNRWPEGEAIS